MKKALSPIELLDEAILLTRKAAGEDSVVGRREIFNQISDLLLKARESVEKHSATRKYIDTWIAFCSLLIRLAEFLKNLLHCKFALLKKQRLYIKVLLWMSVKTLKLSGLAPA